MVAYDLLLKGGHLVDPAQGLNGYMDVAFANGAVAAVAPSISSADARETRDVAGCYVVPGLIDLHTHAYWGGTFLGVDVTKIAARSGMTTAVDAGSAGANNIRGLREHVAAGSQVRILAFLNLSVVGIFAGTDRIRFGEAEDLRLLDVKTCVEAARANLGFVVGIKIRVGASTTGALGAIPLHMAIRAAELVDLPVMAHIGAGMPPRIEDITDPLRCGDVLTHFCTPKANSPLTREGAVLDCILAARERGVIMDVGHGSGSFGFKIARRMLEQGVTPDVISSDVHAHCVNGPAFDVLETMSKFINLGLTLEDVVRATTEVPARVCKRPDLGTLTVGSAADACVLEMRRGRVEFVDSVGDVLVGDKKLHTRGVVLGGKWLVG